MEQLFSSILDYLAKNPGIALTMIASLFFILLGIVLFIVALFRANTKIAKLANKYFSIEVVKHRDLIKHPSQIVKLEIEPQQKMKKKDDRYILRTGSYKFKCLATYADGTKSYFTPYWLKWGGGYCENLRADEIIITSAPNHEKYTELSAWTQKPSRTESNSHIPYSSTGFRYEY